MFPIHTDHNNRESGDWDTIEGAFLILYFDLSNSVNMSLSSKNLLSKSFSKLCPATTRVVKKEHGTSWTRTRLFTIWRGSGYGKFIKFLATILVNPGNNFGSVTGSNHDFDKYQTVPHYLCTPVETKKKKKGFALVVRAQY